MKNTLKMRKGLTTTLKGTAFALTLFSFMGCNNDDNTGADATVTIPATTITPTAKANALPDTSVTDSGTNRNITLNGDTTVTYRVPMGISVTSGTPTNFYTLPVNSTLITGTVDTSNVKISVNGGTAVTDTGLIGADLKLPIALALPQGTYDVTLPTVKLGGADGLAVDSFAIKGITVDSTGSSNFITGVTDSTFPAVNANVANTSVGFKVDPANSGSTFKLTMVAGGTTYTQNARVGTDGKVNFKFNQAGTLGTVSSVVLDLSGS